MPDIDATAFLDADAVQAFHHGEHAAQHAGDGEIGFQLLLGDGIAGLAQLFRIVGYVPGLQLVHAEFVRGEGAHRLQVLARRRQGTIREILQETQHLVGGLRHACGQGALGIVVVAKQPCHFMAQREDPLHQRAVVPAPGMGAGVRGSGHVGGIEFLTQVAVVGIGEHRVIGREFQGEHPAFHVALFGRLVREGLGAVGKAGQLALVEHLPGPGLGGVEQILGEFRLQRRKLLLDDLVAFPLGRLQLDAGQAEVTQGVVDDAALSRVEACVLLPLGDLPVGTEQPLVLAQLGAVGAQLGQAGIVGGAQGVAVHDGV